ncbi:unnamed protein product, partial [Prorocentrum cordatum]
VKITFSDSGGMWNLLKKMKCKEISSALAATDRLEVSTTPGHRLLWHGIDKYGNARPVKLLDQNWGSHVLDVCWLAHASLMDHGLEIDLPAKLDEISAPSIDRNDPGYGGEA